MRICCMTQGTQIAAWEQLREGDGRNVQVRGGMGKPMADSC